VARSALRGEPTMNRRGSDSFFYSLFFIIYYLKPDDQWSPLHKKIGRSADFFNAF
jgi:hypothetical protein